MAKPKPYVPASNKTPDEAYTAAVQNRFPTASPTLPRVAPDGTIFTPGHTYVPSEPGEKTTPTPPPPPSGDDKGTNPNTPLDWRAYLENWGFDSGIVDELDRLFRTYSDPAQASAAAIAYIRGTDWYKTTFPGIQAGMKLGVIGNEADYRSYTNRLNDLYKRYYGRNVTGDDVASMLSKGYDVNRVNAAFQGSAYAAANGGDVQQLLGAFDENGQINSDQLQSLGEEETGLDSLVGQSLDRRLKIARQRFQGVFQGTLASPSLRLLSNGRPAAPSLAGGISTSDVGA